MKLIGQGGMFPQLDLVATCAGSVLARQVRSKLKVSTIDR